MQQCCKLAPRGNKPLRRKCCTLFALDAALLRGDERMGGRMQNSPLTLTLTTNTIDSVIRIGCESDLWAFLVFFMSRQTKKTKNIPGKKIPDFRGLWKTMPSHHKKIKSIFKKHLTFFIYGFILCGLSKLGHVQECEN